jgi:hypothetical protein
LARSGRHASPHPPSLVLIAAVPAQAEDFPTRVVGVADGDTITVLTAAKRQVRIRLAGIDAPCSRISRGNGTRGGRRMAPRMGVVLDGEGDISRGNGEVGARFSPIHPMPVIFPGVMGRVEGGAWRRGSTSY